MSSMLKRGRSLTTSTGICSGILRASGRGPAGSDRAGHWRSRDLFLVNASSESEAFVALSKATGEEVWRREGSFSVTIHRRSLVTWSSPKGATNFSPWIRGRVWRNGKCRVLTPIFVTAPRDRWCGVCHPWRSGPHGRDRTGGTRAVVETDRHDGAFARGDTGTGLPRGE